MKLKYSIALAILDVFIIAVVIVIRSNTTVTVEKEEVASAANVLIQSEDALDNYKNQEIQEYIDSRPVIVYEDMTLEELSDKLNRVLNSTMSGKGELIASYSLEKGVDPYIATAIILQETGCNHSCSVMVNTCYNVGGMKGSGCGAYASFSSIDDGIRAFIDNLYRNYVSRGLVTVETIGPKYAESGTWAERVNAYIVKIRNA